MSTKQQDFPTKRLFTSLTTKKAMYIIAIVGGIAFFNTLFNGFVWDDFGFIINNPDVHSLNIVHLFSGNMFNSGGYYRPIPAFYFALLYTLFGTQAFFFHFVQVTLHILNTILLYLFFRSFFSENEAAPPKDAEDQEWNNLSNRQKKKYRKKYKRIHMPAFKALSIPDIRTDVLSLFLSLVFLVHSMNVESVSYIAASQSELFFLFGILALFFSIKDKLSVKYLFLISGLSLVSLLTKETGFLFLLLIVVFQFLFKKKRFRMFSAFALATLLVYFVIRFAIGGVFFSKPLTFAPIPIAGLSFLGRLANIPAVVLYYSITFFFPLRLAVQQQWIITKLTMQDFYVPLLLDSLFFLALCIAGVSLYKHKKTYFKVYLFFFVWFLLGISMLLQIFPLDMTVADRWMYFPMAGLLGMVGVGVQTILFSLKKHGDLLVTYQKTTMAAAGLGAILILLLSVRTIIRNTNFHDEKTLITHDMQIQDNFSLEDNLGIDYAKAGNMHEALPHLQKSVKLYPYTTNLFNLGNWYEQQGYSQKAEVYYNDAANAAESSTEIAYKHVDNNDYKVYHLLAEFFIINDEYQAAERISKRGVQYYPNSDILFEDLAVSAYILHKQQEALAAAEKAKTLFPSEITNLLYSFILHDQGIPPEMAKAIAQQVKQ